MATNDKIDKFLKCLDRLICDLSNNNVMAVHRNVNQFYYMQKITELRVLKDHVEEQLKRLNFMEENLELAYKEVFTRWQKDARWLNRYLTSRQTVL